MGPNDLRARAIAFEEARRSSVRGFATLLFLVTLGASFVLANRTAHLAYRGDVAASLKRVVEQALPKPQAPDPKTGKPVPSYCPGALERSFLGVDSPPVRFPPGTWVRMSWVVRPS